ncbi:hypothetical protein [Archaeoglobus sp.]
MKVKTGVVLLLLVVSGVATAMAANDEISIIFNSWLEGKPKGIVRLNIETPKTDDVCFIAVHRFPTPYNPTEKWNQSDVVYRGKVSCGEAVVVKDVINLMQVGVREEGGEKRPLYDSPEYAVVVISKEGGFNRILQTDIVKPITDVVVKAEFMGRGEFNEPDGFSKFIETQSRSSECYIHSNPDVCVVDTKLTYLNSIPGLKVAFGVREEPPSVMYIESWGSFCLSSDPDSACPQSMWYSSGKKKTISQTGELSDFISNGQRAIVWGDVEYRYERYAYWDDDFEIYWKYEFFYPTAIRGLSTPQIVGNYYPPTSPPYYAAGPLKGTRNLNFEEPYQSNEKLSLSTYIGLDIGPVSVGISVSPYKAGDDRYSTPYERAVDVSGKSYDWYYWWYRNNDPMTYEVEFYGS